MKGAHFVKNRRVFLLESKIRFMKYSLRLRGAVSGVLVVLSILGIVYLNSLPLMKNREGWKLFLESSKVLSGERLLPEQLYLSEIPVRTEAGALF